MAFIVKPPVQNEEDYFRIFLAGSIEQGSAVNWQEDIQQALSDLDIIIYNPRRDDWDPSWIQSIDNPEFKDQVEWELREIQYADLVVFYFQPGTKSPITLFELGLCSSGVQDIVVCCPEGFWRKGNVDIVCQHFGIAQVATIEELANYVRTEYVRRKTA